MSRRPYDVGKRPISPEEQKQRDLSQWYTPADLAMRLWLWTGLARSKRPLSILEPTCGRGALLEPISQLGIRCARVLAIDVDPENTALLESDLAHRVRYPLEVVTADFLKTGGHGVMDATIANFPYENDADVDCTNHALSFCPVVFGIYCADVFYSEKRGPFWDWVDAPREVTLKKRPAFDGVHIVSGAAGPMTNFCLLELRRRTRKRRAQEAMTTRREFW